MTVRSIVLAASLVTGLSACATAGEPSRYRGDLDRLEADCKARDGLLTPTGAVSGVPARDYACVIRGGSAIQR